MFMKCKNCEVELTDEDIKNGYCHNCLEDLNIMKCSKCGEEVKTEGMCGKCAN